MTRAWLVPVAATLMLLLADDNAMAQTVPAEAQNRELIIGSQIGWTLLSLSFLQAVLALLGIAVVVAVLIWIFERRHNEEEIKAVKEETKQVWRYVGCHQE